MPEKEIPKQQNNRNEKPSNASEDPVMRQKAERLGLTPEGFRTRLTRANQAYATFVENGPLYGKSAEPTFRVSSDPIPFPKESFNELETLGNDIVGLARTLPALSNAYKAAMSELDFRIPFSWRLDTIFDRNGRFRVNEVQVADGADALMTIEQMAYELMTPKQSTPAYLVQTYKERLGAQERQDVRVAILREDTESPYTANIRRMNDFLTQVSGGQVRRAIVTRAHLANPSVLIYDGYINEAYIPPSVLESLGIPSEKLLSAGDFTAVGNKGVYALLYDPNLVNFWLETLGEERLQRLQGAFIPSKTIEDISEIERIRQRGSVLKGTWSDTDVASLDKGRSVFGPWTGEEQWFTAYEQFGQGMRFIEQEFVEPARLSAFLRAKGGKDLERVDWYNRVCVKYVVVDGVARVTATEVTLGKNVKPAGRDCCFTAGTFKD